MRKEESDRSLAAAAALPTPLLLPLSLSLVADIAACRLHVGIANAQWRG